MHPIKSAQLGPPIQNGYVVPDIEAAVRHWTEVMGVGPFFMFDHPQFTELCYRGQKCTADISAALAYWGDVQIELIQQWNDVPSAYRDWPAAAMGGLHHVGVMTQSVSADIRRFRERGIEPVQWGDLGGIRFAYIATDQHPGGMLELIEHGPIDAYYTMFREAARIWDGSEPLRKLP
jgi:hypothetical protein